MRLPEDPTERKRLPIFSGLIKYFPLALAKVSYISAIGNEQHNPGQPLHWDRSKSKDQLDALARHLTDVAIEDQLGHRLDEDTLHALAQVAWRALAELQIRLEEASTAFGDDDDKVILHHCPNGCGLIPVEYEYCYLCREKAEREAFGIKYDQMEQEIYDAKLADEIAKAGGK